jgi:5-methyltetrahydrofolate--homocysteine methyltransferase
MIFKQFPLILDGAMGTNLQKAGMPAGVSAELWILEHPEVLLDLQRRYVAAGSDLIYAPTFGANPAALKKYDLDTRCEEMNRRLVALSRQVGDGVLVGGDISPTGYLPEPVGDAGLDQFAEAIRVQARVLEEEGVDFFVIETQMCCLEAKASVLAVRDVSKKPILVSFTCGPTGRSLWGEDLVDILETLEPLGIDGFGMNCVDDLELLCRELQVLRAHTQLPLLAKPNAGLPQVENGKTVYTLSPEALAAHVPALLESGAQFLGGCCGTTPEHIAALRRAARA